MYTLSPCPSSAPAPPSPISSSIAASNIYMFFNNFLLSLFPPSCCFSQTIIPNLTSYSIYIVYVQAASLSTYKPHRMLLGSHSASRKVNLMFFFAPLCCVCSTRAHGGLRELENSCEFSVSCESATAAMSSTTLLRDFIGFSTNENKRNRYGMKTINSTAVDFVYFPFCYFAAEDLSKGMCYVGF